jgi:hypothetical protein
MVDHILEEETPVGMTAIRIPTNIPITSVNVNILSMASGNLHRQRTPPNSVLLRSS